MNEQMDHDGSQKTDPLAAEIGKRIVEARTGLGFSQLALHTRTKMADPQNKGVSRAVLSLYETGVNKPGAREIRLLCEALKVTPNWLLYGTESPARTMQPSQDFLRGSDLRQSAVIALSVMSLDKVDRETMQALALSLAEKKLGDVRLSSLLMAASAMEDALLDYVRQSTDGLSADAPIDRVIAAFVSQEAEAQYTNFGTLRPAIPEDAIPEFDPDMPPEPRRLSDEPDCNN